MTRSQLTIRALLLPFIATAALAQTATPDPAIPPTIHHPAKPKAKPFQAPWNPDVILLDPAHGGNDSGANLNKAGLEKDYNVAFADRLNTLLTAKGFTVVLTHTDSSSDTTGDQRVELANKSRAVACLLLHASTAGHGVHLFTSALTPLSVADPDSYISPWESAQALALPRSLELANELSTSMNGLKVPLLVGRASVSPIDSMSCPAVAIEITPATADSKLDDDDYQEHIADSIVTALTYWRQQAQAQIAAMQAAANPAAAPATNGAASPDTAPKPKPKPKPPVIITAPDEVPLEPGTTAPKAAPIVRKPPPPTPGVPQ